MKNRVAFKTGVIGAAIILVAGAAVDLQAQRGGGGGRGKPTTITAPAQGRSDAAGRPATGRPDTAGRPDAADRPDNPQRPDNPGRGRGDGAGKPDVAGRPDSVGKPEKGDNGGARGGRPAIGDQLARNPKLSGRIAGLFPQGTDLAKASDGFKNLGQFVAAAHVSRNLGIPFDAVKARMTGPDSMSLGQAIQDLAPKADAKAEAARAQRDADDDIK